jgi:hypothetical protein
MKIHVEAMSAVSTVSSASNPSNSARELLRHAIATLAYRGGKLSRGAPEDFSFFTCGNGCRSAGAVLAHIGHLLNWGSFIANGKTRVA